MYLASQGFRGNPLKEGFSTQRASVRSLQRIKDPNSRNFNKTRICKPKL